MAIITRKYNTSLKSVQRAHRSIPEPNEGPRLVEPGESLPLQFMIDRMMDAGVQKQIHSAMLRLYHFGPNGTIPDTFMDPTQDFGVNVATIHEMKNWLEAKIRSNKEAEEAAIAAAQKIKDDLVTPPEEPPEEPPVEP